MPGAARVRRLSGRILSLLALAVAAWTAPSAVSAGPGTVGIKTDGDITVTLGGQVRVIPTLESNWDFGIASLTGRNIGNTHTNEGGTNKNGYIRTEDRLYFNFARGDLWDVYMALEFDSSFTQQRVDRALATQGPFGDFGLERLNASIKLPWIFSRFNAGWDVYAIDMEGGLIYGDDDPGFNLKGKYGLFDWQIGFNKKIEGDFIPSPTPAGFSLTGQDNDRNIYTLRVNFNPVKGWQLGLLYALDDLKVRGSVATTATTPSIASNRIGGILKGALGPLRLLGEGVYSVGRADKTGVVNAATRGNYDISAYGIVGDLALNIQELTSLPFPVVPHAGIYYTSGDSNPNDKKLNGYTAIVSLARFGQPFGGENTILMDGNAVAGSILYGNLPELHGNQSPLLGVGGLTGTGRGDNPGWTMGGGGLTIGPINVGQVVERITYRTNAYYMRWNESFIPATTPPVGLGAATTTGLVTGANRVSERAFGVEWDNEIVFQVYRDVFVKAQGSVIFPLSGASAAAASLVGVPDRGQFDKPATRLGIELLWNF